MAKNYKITFVSLRAGTSYVLNIGGGSGTQVPLKGGTEPFVTEEDTNDDVFQAIRTQSGSIRILDDGKGDDGTSFDWKDLLHSTDSARPVTLTAGGSTVWMGFMQSQTFSGELYGGTQERDFPVLCPLGVLAGEDVNFNRGLANFACVLKDVCDTIDTKSGSMVHITDVYVQGGSDARNWLLTKIDWQNFAQEDANGVMRAKYSLYEVLENMCMFWGWTARTKGTALYLTCADDSAEQNFLKLNRTQINTLAAATTDTTTGSIVAPTTVTLRDTAANPIFASTNQDDYQIQGPHRAVVKADVSPISDVMEFAPQTVRNQMEAGGYTWVGEDNIGYFTTPVIYNFTSSKLDGSASNDGGFVRRQIYGTEDAESANICDMILHKRYSNGTPIAQLRTKRPMPFGSGTLKLSGSVYAGAELLTTDESGRSFNVRIGIGMTYESAKWLKFSRTVGDHSDASWEDAQYEVKLAVQYSPQLKLMSWDNYHEVVTGWQQAVPLKTPRSGGGLYGYLFIDFMGTEDRAYVRLPEQFELANFKIEYSRDEEIIASGGMSRKITKDRVNSQEYTATNTNSSKDEWNANCIFASDNNMEYGYGLLLDASGNIISTVNYGNNAEHPEQHLANRVSTYWNTAKRMLDLDVMANRIGTITPYTKVTLNGESGTFTPLAIGRNWHDDNVKLTLIQL